ncbi:MAG: hypothetical protein Q8P81_03285 [Nanoarchaeota archaeon]|nr:hypothetical protein [Nanoarchaeota archaeon]
MNTTELRNLETLLENLCCQFGKDLTQPERLAIIKILSLIDNIREGTAGNILRRDPKEDEEDDIEIVVDIEDHYLDDITKAYETRSGNITGAYRSI